MIERINVNKIIAVNAEQAWTAISGIGGIDRWFPVISTCSVIGAGVGATRIMTLADGSAIKDIVEEIDHGHKRFRYNRIESPFPVQSYLGIVEISETAAEKTQVSWTVEIDVQQDQRETLSEFLRTALSDGIQGLEHELRQPHATAIDA